MNPMLLTKDELRKAAFAAIQKELGPAGLVRFIAENLSVDGGDYTEERQEWVGSVTHEEITAGIQELRSRNGGTLDPRKMDQES